MNTIKTKFTVYHEFTNDQIAGLLCTGFEGGMVPGWAEVADSKQPNIGAEFKSDWANFPLYSYPLGDGGYVELEDTHTKKRYKLDRNRIEAGLVIMAEKYPRHFRDFVNENDDAFTGNVFIQCCTLGEVTYG